jgi:hypothetical protein
LVRTFSSTTQLGFELGGGWGSNEGLGSGELSFLIKRLPFIVARVVPAARERQRRERDAIAIGEEST